MNQRTFALLLTMSDAMARPLWSSLPGEEPGFRFAGSPIVIASQMPDVAAGSTPIAFGNWKQAYMVVDQGGDHAQVRQGTGVLAPKRAVRLHANLLLWIDL